VLLLSLICSLQDSRETRNSPHEYAPDLAIFHLTSGPKCMWLNLSQRWVNPRGVGSRRTEDDKGASFLASLTSRPPTSISTRLQHPRFHAPNGTRQTADKPAPHCFIVIISAPECRYAIIQPPLTATKLPPSFCQLPTFHASMAQGGGDRLFSPHHHLIMLPDAERRVAATRIKAGLWRTGRPIEWTRHGVRKA
jgi:hypothetical protein